MEEKNKKKVLIAEDDVFISEMYSVKLAEAGFEVDVVENGEEALKKIEENGYGVILLDIVMPKVNGWEVLDKVKIHKKEKGYKIIMLTNLDDKSNIQQAMENGADDYLIKSLFTPEEVLQKINKNLQK